MMIEQGVLKALQAAAILAYSASSIASLSGWTAKTRIKPIGRTLIPPTDNCYIEFINVPNNSHNDYWGDERLYQGSFRIILHWKIDDSGPYLPMQYVDEIGSYFTKNKIFDVGGGVALKIYDVPDASGPIENGSELLFPVTLPYRCFAA